MWKYILISLLFIPLIGGVIGGLIYYTMNQENLEFNSVCDNTTDDQYTDLCNNVGKHAFGIKQLYNVNKDTDYGPILGVAWRRQGSIISSYGQERRYSEGNSYYYIIGSDTNKNYQYLRLTTETEAK